MYRPLVPSVCVFGYTFLPLSTDGVCCVTTLGRVQRLQLRKAVLSGKCLIEKCLIVTTHFQGTEAPSIATPKPGLVVFSLVPNLSSSSELHLAVLLLSLKPLASSLDKHLVQPFRLLMDKPLDIPSKLPASPSDKPSVACIDPLPV